MFFIVVVDKLAVWDKTSQRMQCKIEADEENVKEEEEEKKCVGYRFIRREEA